MPLTTITVTLADTPARARSSPLSKPWLASLRALASSASSAFSEDCILGIAPAWSPSLMPRNSWAVSTEAA